MDCLKSSVRSFNQVCYLEFKSNAHQICNYLAQIPQPSCKGTDRKDPNRNWTHFLLTVPNSVSTYECADLTFILIVSAQDLTSEAENHPCHSNVS